MISLAGLAVTIFHTFVKLFCLNATQHSEMKMMVWDTHSKTKMHRKHNWWITTAAGRNLQSKEPPFDCWCFKMVLISSAAFPAQGGFKCFEALYKTNFNEHKEKCLKRFKRFYDTCCVDNFFIKPLWKYSLRYSSKFTSYVLTFFAISVVWGFVGFFQQTKG